MCVCVCVGFFSLLVLIYRLVPRAFDSKRLERLIVNLSALIYLMVSACRADA